VPFLLTTPARARTAPDAAPEQILIAGKRPGPGLWKVSRDGHVLWVFGTHSPLPLRMVWRSQQVETVLAQSQAFLGAPGVGVSVGWAQAFNVMTALPLAIGAKNNPDGARLQDVAPALDNPRGALRDFKNSPLDDLACFTKIIRLLCG